MKGRRGDSWVQAFNIQKKEKIMKKEKNKSHELSQRVETLFPIISI